MFTSNVIWIGKYSLNGQSEIMLFFMFFVGSSGSSNSQSTGSHAPRRQNTTIDSSNTKENILTSGRKTPNTMESPKVCWLNNLYEFILLSVVC